ncbi:1-phosphofructokinase [Pseudochelatococcus lubricantis]|uniref:1-phosphofructokinase n=1 Tax=Pseudochelatococcus lubricantis TaxID=1538102 RepID=UPI0035E8F7A5
MSIITVTLNPAIDQTVTLDRLTRGVVNRASSVRLDAGGKGFNVASCLADWGERAVVTGLLGAENPEVFEALLHRKGLEDRFVRIAGATRTNIKLVDREETTDINLPGFTATPEALGRVEAEIAALATRSALTVVGGSLPPGTAADHYATMLAGLAATGTCAILDTSGPALAAALAGTVRPYAIKPNLAELTELTGKSCESLSDVAAAAVALCRTGIALVVVSMGAEGALFVTAGGILRALPPPVTGIGSTVGAGDAMVAGIVAALREGGDIERIARLGTAFAVGKLGLAGPNLPGREAVEALAARTGIESVATEEGAP